MDAAQTDTNGRQMESETDKNASRAAMAAEAAIFILADSGGAVGAFLSRAEATAVKKQYPSVPMLVYAFPLRHDMPADRVYVVPYRPTNAVAYASNSRIECEVMQKTLLTIGLTYEDPLDYWECAVGRLIESGKKRLIELQELERLALDGSACAEMRKASDEKTKQLFALHDRAVEAALASVGHEVNSGAVPSKHAVGPFDPLGASDNFVLLAAPDAVSILEFVVPDRADPPVSEPIPMG